MKIIKSALGAAVLTISFLTMQTAPSQAQGTNGLLSRVKGSNGKIEKIATELKASPAPNIAPNHQELKYALESKVLPCIDKAPQGQPMGTLQEIRQAIFNTKYWLQECLFLTKQVRQQAVEAYNATGNDSYAAIVSTIDPFIDNLFIPKINEMDAKLDKLNQVENVIRQEKL